MSHSINEAEILIEKLLNYFNLTSLQELANKFNIKQSALSSWKSRNSVNAIKKRCRELGIYNEIFGNLNSNINNQTIGDKNNNEIRTKSLSINMLSYDNINMKKIIRDWGVQGYGIAVGLILYLKENDTLNLADIDLLADDLKTSTFLIKKVIEECNYFLKENNEVTLRNKYEF